MGADLITCSMMFPVRNGMTILKAEAKRLNKAFEAINGDAARFDELGIGSTLAEYAEYLCLEPEETKEIMKRVKQDIDTLSNINTFEDLEGRDSSWHGFSVNGVEVRCCFAGELSWGDEPEGYGYTTLCALSRLGIESKFHDAIPWDIRKKK